MAHIPGLRSPYDQVGELVYFGRMLDKIRLHAAGTLPPEYVEFIGGQAGVFDGRCVRFLHVNYDDLKAQTLAGASDEEVLEWAFTTGRRPNDEEVLIWNAFMSKRGWRDDASDRVLFRVREAGLPEDGSIQSMFDYIDADEGRPARFPKEG